MVEDASLDRLNKYLETLHFAFRGLVAEPDSILKSQGLSRIHHRLLFFIGRNPGLSVNELVESMRLTKQAINRAYEAMGFSRGLEEALELDVLAETIETEESREFDALAAKEGHKAAIAWRRRKYGLE